MVCVFPSRGVKSDLRIPRCLRLASRYPKVAQAAQTNHLGGSLPAVPDRKARQPPAREKGSSCLTPPLFRSLGIGGGHTTSPHHGPAQRRPRSPPSSGTPWSAGCDESRTSGAE